MHSVTRFGIIFLLLLSGSLSSLWAQTIEPVTNSLAIAAPFGVEIGKTTCRQAANALNMTNPHQLRKLDSIPASAQVVPKGYPGAVSFYMLCERGGDTPVTYASLFIFGGADQHVIVVSDLASKYKLGGRVKGGNELQASNGNIMVYSQQTYEPAPREILTEVRYNSLEYLEMEKKREQKYNEEANKKENARINAL